jgi:hypothetical protein
MHFGYLGASASYSGEKQARDALAIAERIVDKLDTEVRVLKSRRAAASTLVPAVSKLAAATKERDRIKAVVKMYDLRGKRADALAKEADAKADAAHKRLKAALAKEVATRRSELDEVNNAIALNRIERDRSRMALFDADKAEVGLERALARRMARYQRHLSVFNAREKAYTSLRLTEATKKAVVGFARETLEFLTSNISLDSKEITAIRSAKATGNKAVVTSPSKMRPVQAGLLRHLKEQLSLTPGASLPSKAEIELLTRAMVIAVPRRKGENETAYAMRIRRYVYRAAIRLANLKHSPSAAVLPANKNQILGAVRATTDKDTAAIEEEHKAAVFAPAGEQTAVSVVDSATNATSAVVPAATPIAVEQASATVAQFQSSTPGQAADLAQVASNAITPFNTSTPAFVATAEQSASTALPTVQSSPDNAAAQIDVAAAIENAKNEVADGQAQAASDASATDVSPTDDRPFYKKPIGMGIIGLGLYAAVKAFSR